jgi:hypothetical protein
MHAILTVFLGNDFSSILNDDLVGIKSAIAPNTIATVHGLDDLDPNVVLSSGLGSLLEAVEASVTTSLSVKSAVRTVTFVEHEPILAILIAASLGQTDTRGVFLQLDVSPDTSCIPNEYIW